MSKCRQISKFLASGVRFTLPSAPPAPYERRRSARLSGAAAEHSDQPFSNRDGRGGATEHSFELGDPFVRPGLSGSPHQHDMHLVLSAPCFGSLHGERQCFPGEWCRILVCIHIVAKWIFCVLSRMPAPGTPPLACPLLELRVTTGAHRIDNW